MARISPDDDDAREIIASISRSLEKALNPLGQPMAAFSLPAMESLSQSLRGFREAYIAPLQRIGDAFANQWKPFLEAYQQRFPKNWPEGFLDLDVAREIIEGEGIPLVYVPRASVVAQLVAAADRNDRVQILLDNQVDVLEDCEAALGNAFHESVCDQVPLVLEAIAVLRIEKHAAAQALAVVVADTLIGANIHDSHQRARNGSALPDLETIHMSEVLRVFLAVAPVSQFLFNWHPTKNPNPEPSELSRHVTVHQATARHLRPDNALIAVLLTTGLICAFSEMKQWLDSQGK